jgi:hypothetical protein
LDPTSITTLALLIPEDDDLSLGLAFASDQKPSNMTLVKEYLGMLAFADNPTLTGKQASFVSPGESKVQVEFEIVARRLQRRVLESAVREKQGDKGVRILRLLMETGKMDEKQASARSSFSSVIVLNELLPRAKWYRGWIGGTDYSTHHLAGSSADISPNLEIVLPPSREPTLM